jgi:RNA polymerase sigma-70 factor (ECF subfamily)
MDKTRSSLLVRVRNPTDAASWGEFVSLYEPLLLSYVKKKGLKHDDAQDVVQGIFISLLRVLPTFELDRTVGRFRTWLWRVACHAIADWARRQKRQTKLGKIWIETRDDAVNDPEPEAEWEEDYRKRVLEFVLQRVQAQTVARTWACFEQHILRNRPGQEVAAELGLSSNSVYVNASRVLAKVRELCAEYMEEQKDVPDDVS